ncbi:uncharacterized protein BDZ83DRAFT_28013 [Colletotrichum acutatum]|uniref:Uncharacterized protein n=1 Tax=Glomerella acutata TaxID=27357 RepID=A0AAD8XC57_GLOAC|nr:uncharacterized protein BDZ83DRAFT_28013 [Colletotrichum acutatum]KAK1717439.1 hypothetical protein BDZ83DRAFT_28013 [Colletotrichum acutatum]
MSMKRVNGRKEPRYRCRGQGETRFWVLTVCKRRILTALQRHRGADWKAGCPSHPEVFYRPRVSMSGVGPTLSRWLFLPSRLRDAAAMLIDVSSMPRIRRHGANSERQVFWTDVAVVVILTTNHSIPGISTHPFIPPTLSLSLSLSLSCEKDRFRGNMTYHKTGNTRKCQESNVMAVDRPLFFVEEFTVSPPPPLPFSPSLLFVPLSLHPDPTAW